MDEITVTIVKVVSGFSNGDKGGKDYVMERKLWLIWVANSVEWISLQDTTALITVLSKKELLRLLVSLFTLFLSFSNLGGSLNIACWLCWIKVFNSRVIQGLPVGCCLVFRSGKNLSTAKT